MRKLITLTWTDKRLDAPRWSYGRPLVALWVAEGTDADLNAALEYAAIANRRDPSADYAVHTFATNEAEWRFRSVEAHNNGSFA